jgi:hypothetical protein
MHHSSRQPERQSRGAATAPSLERVKLFGIEWPFPRWAIGIGAVILLLSLVASMTKLVVVPLVEHWEERHNSLTDLELEEYRKHIDEIPVQSSVLGDVEVKLFRTDGCLLVSRKSTGLRRWLPDLTRSHRESAPGRLATGGALPWEGTAYAQEKRPADRCPNPHPGKFTQSEGEKKGCWLQIFREWPDGCKHYQWYDVCYGVWDTEKDGKAKLYWVTCNH